MINNNDGLTLLTKLEEKWFQATHEVSIAEACDGGLQHQLIYLAQKVENVGREMRERREKVMYRDPYVFGMLLAWLDDIVADENSQKMLTRFQVFQASGFWCDVEYTDFASDLTGVAVPTWRNWRQVAQRYLRSAVGIAYLNRAGITPIAFVETVPLDKALRASALVSTGRLEPHQLDALVDPTVSTEQMRQVLRLTADEWAEVQAEKDAADKQWVEHGDVPAPVVFDPGTRTIRVQWLADGEFVSYTVLRMPVPAHDKVEELQKRIVDFCTKGVV